MRSKSLARDVRVDAALVELVRPQDLYLHAHLAQRLLERRQKVLGIRDVASLRVRDARETLADELLVALGDSGRDLAQRVDRVGVEDESDLVAALPERVRDGLRHEHLAQVAGVYVAGDADAAHHDVRTTPRASGHLSGPLGYAGGYAGAGIGHERSMCIGSR